MMFTENFSNKSKLDPELIRELQRFEKVRKQIAKEKRFWTALFYLSMFIIFLWLVLKSFGIINTPFWLQYGVPIGSFALGLITLFRSLGKDMSDLRVDVGNNATIISFLGKSFDKLEFKVDKISFKVNHLEKDIHILNNKLNSN